MNNLCPMFELEWEEMNHLNELALSVNNFSQGQSYIATCRENKIGIQFFVTFFFSSQGTVYDCWHMLLTFFFFFDEQEFYSQDKNRTIDRIQEPHP